jgi:hypothetical protein
MAAVHASPAVTPAASSPLHVGQVVEANGGSGGKRKDRCRLGAPGRARKNQTCNSDRENCAQHEVFSLFSVEADRTTDQLDNKTGRSMNGLSGRNNAGAV